MISVDQAIKFCEELAKDPVFNKQYENDGELKYMQDIVDMLNEYNYMKDKYGKYEYICDRMSSDEYYELEDKYEAECGEDEECEKDEDEE